MIRTLLTSACVLAALASQAQAETIAAWGLFGQPGNQTTTSATANAANVSGAAIVRGSGLNAAGASNSMSSNGWNGVDANDYFEFGFDVAPGFQVDLDELIIGTRSSNTGPGTIGVYTSVDGFASSVYSIAQVGTNYSNSILDMSAFAGLTGSFRVRLLEIGDTQADGDGSTASTGTFRISDYYDGSNFTDSQFTGTVSAVPEPSTIVLVGLGMVGLLVARFRRKQN